MLAWLTQLGMSVALPLGGAVLLGVWLRQQFSLGSWVVLSACVVGLILAMDGLRYSIRAMTQMNQEKDKKDNAVSYNEHE